MAIEKFNLVLDHTRLLSPKILHLAFKKQDGQPFDFIPGQFITFLIESNGQIKRRSYSIASIYGQSKYLEIAISYIQDGIASEKLFTLKPGENLLAMGPAGKLIIQDDHAKRYILVGTGTGIAPYRAMLPDLAKRMENSDFKVVILFGAQYRQDLLYLEDFLNFAKTHPKFSIRTQLSREDLNSSKQPYEYPGYVQTAFPDLNLNPSEDIIFLCGNPNMIDSAFMELQMMGFESTAVKREKYISSN